MKVSKEIIQDIVDQLDFGLKCFYNIKTNEVAAFPDAAQLVSMDSEFWDSQIEKVDDDFDNFIEISNMSSFEGFKVMEDFANLIEDHRLKTKLIQALEGHKPFANFKNLIEQSENFRKKWFAFKNNRLSEWVMDQLKD